jgi:hypothetical protein
LWDDRARGVGLEAVYADFFDEHYLFLSSEFVWIFFGLFRVFPPLPIYQFACEKRQKDERTSETAFKCEICLTTFI